MQFAVVVNILFVSVMSTFFAVDPHMFHSKKMHIQSGQLNLSHFIYFIIWLAIARYIIISEIKLVDHTVKTC